MALSENISDYFKDFGVVAEKEEISGYVIFDMPDILLGGEEVLAAQYTIRYPTALFALSTGDEITVDGIDYSVLNSRKEDDGKISIAELSKV